MLLRSIARDLSQRDPGNAGWARDISVSLDRIGNVAVAEGDLTAARDAYAEALEIARDLSQRDPGNAEWARDVVVSHWKLAQSDPDNATVHWAEVVTRMEDMEARGILLPTDRSFLDTARKNLASAGGD